MLKAVAGMCKCRQQIYKIFSRALTSASANSSISSRGATYRTQMMHTSPSVVYQGFFYFFICLFAFKERENLKKQNKKNLNSEVQCVGSSGI